jgi:putative oxidoreductase
METLLSLEQLFRKQLNNIGQFFPLLMLRLLLAWEFWEAGLQKLNGENWFQHIQTNFPFPFSVIDPQISWFMATWFELLGGLALLIGLGTRYVSISLVVLTIVATIAVHIPAEGWSSISDMLSGYAITDKGFGNYKIPLMYMIAFMPLIFMGAGKASVDHVISQYLTKRHLNKNS